MASLEFIEKRTATDVVTVDWTDLFTTKYDVYDLFFDMSYNTAGYLDMYLLDSSGNLLSGSYYDVAVLEMQSNAAEHDYYYSNSTIWRDMGGYLNNIDAGYGMKMTIFNPTDTDTWTYALTTSNSPLTSTMFGTKGIACYTATDGVHGLRVQSSSGGSTTFDYLNVSIYGYK